MAKEGKSAPKRSTRGGKPARTKYKNHTAPKRRAMNIANNIMRRKRWKTADKDQRQKMVANYLKNIEDAAIKERVRNFCF